MRFFANPLRHLRLVFGALEGDRVERSLRVASAELPAELAELISKDPAAKKNWERLTPGQQRMLREEVFAASQPAHSPAPRASSPSSRLSSQQTANSKQPKLTAAD